MSPLRASLLALLGLGISLVPAQATLILAGDIDNFSPGNPADTPTQRPLTANAISWEWNNVALHGGVGLKFDIPGQVSNHTFAYTFQGLPLGQIDLSAPVLLEARFRSNNFSTDSIALQLWNENMPPAYPGPSWFPSWNWGLNLPTFFSTYGVSGTAPTGITTVIDLRTINVLAGRPLAGTSIAETMNLWGYLDVFVQDDTAIDYLQLSFTEIQHDIPEPAHLAALALLLLPTFLRFRRPSRAAASS